MFSYMLQSVKRAGVLALIALALLAGARGARAAEYLIQQDDTLDISVSGEPGLSKKYTVNERGEIEMEMVGPVKVSGKSLAQIKEDLSKRISKFVKVFELTVLVVGDTGSSKVLVYGEVAKPGPVKVRNGARLLDVIAEAGLPTANADTKQVKLARKGSSKTEIIDLDAVQNDLSLNVEINPGDTVTVPSRISRSVTVDGEVTNPGVKPLDQVKTAYGAIQAAGAGPNIDWKRVILRRKGSSVPLSLDLSGVRRGDLKSDLELSEGDRITVQSTFAGNATVTGEVRTPGEKPLNGPTQIQDLILSQAGGVTEKADRRAVQVIRDDKPAMIIDLTEIESGTRRSTDPGLTVQPGDKIFVPAGQARLDGEVKNKGVKPIGDNNHLMDFINNAGGGLTEKADPTRVKIIRNGKQLRLIDLTKIASGEIQADDPSMELQAGDVVSVPDDSNNRYVILGGVAKPGPYPVKSGMTLLDALAQAGSFTQTATFKQIVIAPGNKYDAEGNFLEAGKPAEAPKPEETEENARDKKRKKGKSGESKEKTPEELGLTVVDYKKLIKGDPSQNPVIKAGDRILVAERSPQDRNGNRGGGLLEVLGRLLFFAPVF